MKISVAMLRILAFFCPLFAAQSYCMQSWSQKGSVARPSDRVAEGFQLVPMPMARPVPVVMMAPAVAAGDPADILDHGVRGGRRLGRSDRRRDSAALQRKKQRRRSDCGRYALLHSLSP